jgi:hypothetical protein
MTTFAMPPCMTLLFVPKQSSPESRAQRVERSLGRLVRAAPEVPPRVHPEDGSGTKRRRRVWSALSRRMKPFVHNWLRFWSRPGTHLVRTTCSIFIVSFRPGLPSTK